MANNQPNVSLIGGGIKCDNKECDYVDLSIEIKDYKHWVNKPCPNCGCNLLTEKDYNTVQAMMKLTDFFNRLPFSKTQNTEDKSITFHMDGSGDLFIDNNNINIFDIERE